MDSERDEIRLELAAEVIRSMGELRLSVRGSSMVPSLLPGDVLTIRRADVREMGEGEIVLSLRGNRFVIHRLLGRAESGAGPRWITRGDALTENDPPVGRDDVLGRVVRIQRSGRSWKPAKPSSFARLVQWLVRHSGVLMKFLLWWHCIGQPSAKRSSGAPLSARVCS
ncbi:MAG TPA: S24/S26 family peptidase [Candidatus Cybelea sp.]|nr:S24/S26 family peptidase [Candidatus Cybelea sp.]